jgi:hypothetical protein
MFINVGFEGTLSMYKKRFFIMLIVVSQCSTMFFMNYPTSSLNVGECPLTNKIE